MSGRARTLAGPLRRTALPPAMALLMCAAPAFAMPDLRQPRQAGPLTVYADDVRRDLYYYAPGELAIALKDDGQPDVHLLHARYTGSASTGDRGAIMLRSILTLRVVMAGPLPPQLTEARNALTAIAGRPIELRPLPIRRLESAVVYAPLAPASEPGASAAAPPEAAAERSLPPGHFEASEGSAPARDTYWTERTYTLGLPPEDAQLLSSALERGLLALSLGYAFLADGMGPDDRPLEELSGSPALASALEKAIAPERGSDGGEEEPSGPYVVRAGAVGVIADLARWPHLVRRVDINDSAPPGYAALDVYCYDFSQGGESPLYEKQVEIEADGVGGRRVGMTATFTRSQPDLYARSLRFPVAVRLDRPYRFRVIAIARDGTSAATPWTERASWTELLDVTAQGDHR